MTPNDLVKQGSVKTSDCAVGARPVSFNSRFQPSRGLYVGATGSVSVIMSTGDAVTFNSLAAGVIHPISVIQVNSSGTTATGIIATY